MPSGCQLALCSTPSRHCAWHGCSLSCGSTDHCIFRGSIGATSCEVPLGPLFSGQFAGQTVQARRPAATGMSVLTPVCLSHVGRMRPVLELRRHHADSSFALPWAWIRCSIRTSRCDSNYGCLVKLLQ